MPSFDISTENGVTVIALGPEYESIFGSELGQFQEIIDLAETIDPPRVVVDLGQTNYFGSGFLGLLVQLAKRVKRHPGGQFGVCHVTGLCRDIIQGTRMDHYFDVFETRTDAIGSYSAPSE